MAYSKQIRCVGKMPVSVVKCCFSLPNWLGWTKFNIIDQFWSLLLIIFSISFTRVLKGTFGWNILGKL